MSLDVALVADDEVPYATLEAAVREGAGALLDGLWWFDEYRGEQVGEGNRSLALRLRLQAPDRQLTDEDEKRVKRRTSGGGASVLARPRTEHHVRTPAHVRERRPVDSEAEPHPMEG
jgi:phenylalanyl-tRNA synthetase beta chain